VLTSLTKHESQNFLYAAEMNFSNSMRADQLFIIAA